ncbi:peptide chain release factor N(5)-glutamine methyltransferase [Patescibacteria group bacterium]|nr:peptide chain release factor N(5)-glutamine methyltransferase [Patescibacteria group bacterium]MBU4452815.1 peptide chain release factor N(5)-glutamine methyltransferase [Patescibacteria group bacterium]MCG2687769.1 peptide chain release factor N(5)-glutamine methyltransferase [Candidatus Parcubacteria bacterium]
MTIFEALNWGRQQLKDTSHEKQVMQANPMLDAQILLSNCLNKSNSYLFAHAEEELSDQTIERYLRFIKRRARHEPISQILQQKEFFGRNFFVNQFVLTPRPETETLIEHALENITQATTIIDIGTGSGAIAVTLACQLQQPIIAIDIDPKAIQVAKFNAKLYKVEHLISFLTGSLLDPYLQKNIKETKDGHVMILANLPYLTQAQWENSDPDVKEYEPKHALVSGVDGLDLYDKLLEQINDHRDRFPTNLEIYLEIDPRQAMPIKNLVNEFFPNSSIDLIKDISSQNRIVKIKL